MTRRRCPRCNYSWSADELGRYDGVAMLIAYLVALCFGVLVLAGTYAGLRALL